MGKSTIKSINSHSPLMGKSTINSINSNFQLSNYRRVPAEIEMIIEFHQQKTCDFMVIYGELTSKDFID